MHYIYGMDFFFISEISHTARSLEQLLPTANINLFGPYDFIMEKVNTSS